MSNKYPDITVDGVIFTYHEGELKVLLIKRKIEPFKDVYALPGGFLNENETGEHAISRVLNDECGLNILHYGYLEQLYTFTDVERDPRQRVISITYYGLINSIGCNLDLENDHASEVKWYSVGWVGRMGLAFDHKKIFRYAVQRLQNKVRYEPIGFDLLPEYFTLSELHELYSAILDKDIDRRNFNKKILKYSLLGETNLKTSGHVGRQAKLYKFNESVYKNLVVEGFNFEI